MSADTCHNLQSYFVLYNRFTRGSHLAEGVWKWGEGIGKKAQVPTHRQASAEVPPQRGNNERKKQMHARDTQGVQESGTGAGAGAGAGAARTTCTHTVLAHAHKTARQQHYASPVLLRLLSPTSRPLVAMLIPVPGVPQHPAAFSHENKLGSKKTQSQHTHPSSTRTRDHKARWGVHTQPWDTYR